jgi:WhiB family redox-sensing transcriptional regulator
VTALEHVQVIGVHQATTAEELLDMIETLRPAWHARAACHGMTEVMFPVAEHGHRLDTSAARALCARCPVRSECADYGANEPDGVWGGQYVGVRASRRGPRSSATAETIDAMNDGTWWTAQQLAARLGISRESARRRLYRLSRSDIVEIRVGNGCTPTEYRLKETT